METNKFAIALTVVALVVSIFNIHTMNGMMDMKNNDAKIVTITGMATAFAADVIPKGVPETYGEELTVSFDDISPSDRYKADDTIKKMANLDKSIDLEGSQLERYINILYHMENGISCEYCCGARSIIFENGKSACGCAHSYAMRGLAKYLITEHGDEYIDAEIHEEVAKWKTLFFPTQMSNKAKILQETGEDLNYINLASNKFRGIDSRNGGMVGGC